MSHNLAPEAKNKMESVTACYTPAQLKFLVSLVEEGYFANRSEAVRAAMQCLVLDYHFVWEAAKRKVMLLEFEEDANNGKLR